jgi:hypothetical protein
MRKLFFLLLAAPLWIFAQDKTVLNVTRVWPKADKVQQFEKALAAHVQKYHKNDFAWRVFTVETGPDAGAYHLVEGPSNWDGFDKRGDLGKEHQSDWDMHIQPLLQDRQTVMYVVYRGDLSSSPMIERADKISINHVFYKPGYYGDMQDLIKGLKKTWDDNGQSVAVFESNSSGAPQFAVVTRYKFGLKEKEVGFRPAMNISFAKANGGESSFTKWVEGWKQAVDNAWSEMLFFKPELSSK